DETFFVNVTNISGATAGDTQGLGTITNDDITVPTLSINDVSMNEGNSGTTAFNFTVSLDAPAGAGGINFTVNTADGTATTADSDHVAIVNRTATITPGHTAPA